jgi:AraC-like DNA-binding protein
MKPGRRLLRFLDKFRFEPLVIHQVVDSTRRLSQNFDPDFPILIRFHSFPAYREMLGANWLNWHEHLEIILPVTGSGRFRSGEQVVDFAPGDLLLVDNKKLHGMLDLDGEHRSLVIHFLPEFVYGIGSPRCDAAFLGPFLERTDSALPILRTSDALAGRVHDSLIRLVSAFFSTDPPEDRQAACKLHFLDILYCLRRHFELQDTDTARCVQQRQRVQRLKRLFDFLNENHSQKLRLAEAAAMVGMSETRFKNVFKRTAGETFAQYVIHLRLAKAQHLLRETDLSMAQIACEAGFCDQSHLDNRFKENFRISPKAYRARHKRNGTPVRSTAFVRR